jgi:hypothetical protein
MESLIAFLSPSTNMNKVIQRAEVIMKQLQRPECPQPCYEQKFFPLKCEMCGNTDENNIIEDNHAGMIICNGSDNQGCGYVMVEQDFAPVSTVNNDFVDLSEEYSTHQQFQSTMIGGNNRMRKLNMKIETDINKYGHEDPMTSEMYKDKQRKEAYDLLNQVQCHTNVGVDVINRVKHLFHLYRCKMIRIHKLELAVLALFYIVLNDSSSSSVPLKK